jgi:hypothetical protein
METIVTTLNILVFIFLLIHPILILKYLKINKILNFTRFFIICLISSLILCVFAAWWLDKGQKDLLLYSYGYNDEDTFMGDPFKSVKKEHMDKAIELYESSFGIGWPIKAILSYIFYLPYLIIVYLLIYFINKYKMKKKNCNQ